MGAKPSTLEINILSHGYARARLAAAEGADFYRGSCADSRPNAAARRAHVYESYAYSMDYQIVLDATCSAAKKYLPQRLLTDLGAVDIIVMYPSADGGMPHTRPDCLICLPYQATMPSAETLEHELWHIHQRMYPTYWATALKAAWSYEPWTGSIPRHLEENRRYNPDTIATPLWCWRGTWVPVPVFRYPSAPELGAAVTWFYNVKTGVTHHEVPADVAAFFGERQPAAVLEHPYETAAYILAGGSQSASSEAARRLREYMGIK